MLRGRERRENRRPRLQGEEGNGEVSTQHIQLHPYMYSGQFLRILSQIGHRRKL